MNLYNCTSAEELALREIELQGLTTIELLDLAKNIKKEYENCILQDETIVISAIVQIAEELWERVG